ncbi:1-deoxy-D-xylulose-5-phosphate synthase [Oleiphilus sp. HI0071]|uniref:1-deoxy-D-xylulose-5-phosphate synthase n=1 Tax=Oleiphilus sp. HI0080 TaxID=1822255 RepID=UPI0007C4095E|nr:1-deoxy-D-xylulose-5-phosphate synthase [Oleiphilus sp. HI0080]KZY60216.1 1-deoxy-D-xylulose-5-phosphate synthase [Oleiphilus sp. HI0065]KZY82528.1 1-deoxy-D-xylulose-5-phosphate synthase [Oleiphilus sp. HI0071]KZY92867.1 1-deoxy-D-xylulose-5-phosphate synthase [Oleiphilus sp. HI0073]KZZ44767.1 1-deoxy-D-xylulose-5-phosphate synthase [Oleiphilus sp. HI0118]KZZ50683.1 1-deoxy-D-xylulose-5-phosphate synthase [Oleiphilus sp. HI0122]KZZ74414.1 1-deoxy-D-xylulose-5-phosphate synthase [Oleiphilu
MYDLHTFNEIPTERPFTPLLDKIDSPHQLRLLSQEQLFRLCFELRHFLLFSVGQSGGHFGAGLGVVELTAALHYVFNTPDDRIVWDVGHQAYPHKILTGRRDDMTRIRQQNGPAAFPTRSESEYDTFGVGHSSTSISAALGMALAAKHKGEKRRSIAVIGDGALTAGMAFEALSHAGDIAPDLLVILNDNDMSISNNVGGLKNHLAQILSSKAYNQVRDGSKRVLSNTPGLMEFARKTEEHVKGLMAPGTLFEELGFNYIGPIDGHDMPVLLQTLENMKHLSGPQFLHVVTKKGRGFAPAESDPIGYHAINKIEASAKPAPQSVPTPIIKPSYSNIFGQWICDAAELDERVVGITPAMKEGSDLIAFAQRFPDRYYDVAIAEQHAVTLAAGMACEGMKPVVAIYSTFLQRGYDQLVHDVAVQNLDVTFAIDRAGLVGADGPTHAGAFDLSFMRCIPNMLIMAPSDENECRQMLHTALAHKGPSAVRYPRGKGPGVKIEQELNILEIGQSRTVRDGSKVAILSFGALLPAAQAAAEKFDATVIDMRFVKPLDTQAIIQACESHDLIVTLEENAIAGGAGAGVAEFMHQKGIGPDIMILGLPDTFIDHGRPEVLLAECGLDEKGILSSIEARLSAQKGSLISPVIQSI